MLHWCGMELPTPRSWWPRILFVVSAAVAALVLRLSWEDPLVGVGVLGLISAWVATKYIARRRARSVLRSGDLGRVLARWQRTIDKLPNPETMGPLMTATALAAYGWVERAREALRQAKRGPAWDAALEHRVFLDALLLIFEGDSQRALEQAQRLETMPVPPALPFLSDRIRVLRQSVGALARAFSHRASPEDRQVMLSAGSASPLVHWAMRYGAAIFDIDHGDFAGAAQLVVDAPEWPTESCFRRFHDEISVALGADRPAPHGSVPPSAVADGQAVSPGTGLPTDGQPADASASGSAAVVDEEDRLE